MSKILSKFAVDLLDQPVNDVETEPRGQIVPNRQPTLKNFSYKIAIIGEAPGKDEEFQGTPFVGMSGRFLTALLSKAQIVREACFVGNICQYRPPGNEIKYFKRDGEEITSGLEQLTKDLEEFNPNICILLGKTALWAAKGVDGIADWRGSYFVGEKSGPFLGRKCIASFHPAACLRNYEYTPLLTFDLIKAKREAETKELLLPIRDLCITLDAQSIVNELEKIQLNKTPIAIDIEGYVGDMRCISVAPSKDYAFMIPFVNGKIGNFYATEDEEIMVFKALASVLADCSVEKILQNSLYDRFVMQYSYGLIVRNTKDDTMLKHWELYCELEKALGVQASIYTKEPYWKGERENEDRSAFWIYGCRDSAVTFEINTELNKYLDTGRMKHYYFNVDLLNPLLYMELRGIRYNKAEAKNRLNAVNAHIYRQQALLDQLAGVGITATTAKLDRLKLCQQQMCHKRDVNKPFKDCELTYPKVYELCKKDTLTPEEIGEFNTLCELSMNVKADAYKNFLYNTLKLPIQYNTDPVTKKKSRTTDSEALLTIQKKEPHKAVEYGIYIMELRTRSQTLRIKSDPDGRIRCGYNVVGTVTGRLSCYKSPTGSGFNLQTIPDAYSGYPDGHPLREGMRDLFQADEGYYMAQCDLKGSDGWTIGAHLKDCGDPSMIDDLTAGIKPASRICYMLRHGVSSLAGKQRDEVKELLKTIKKEDWDYFACKIGIWGICYLMGPDLLSAQIMEESNGKICLSRTEVKEFHNAVFAGYHVKLWHTWMERHLARKPELASPSGHVRRFFGRSILGDALAHEPQSVTTYATNLAAWKLWHDPENRISNKLRIEPLHQVHDALVCQFKIEDTEWASNKIKSYFENPIIIANQEITIPFEGNYGTNWALDNHSKVGNI